MTFGCSKDYRIEFACFSLHVGLLDNFELYHFKVGAFFEAQCT